MENRGREEPRIREALAAIMEEYKPRSAQEAETVLRELFAGTLEDMLKAELEEHLGYKRHSQEAKATGNRRNGKSGKSGKSVRTSMGEMELAIPRDQYGEFEPAAVPKNKRDVSEIEEKVIKMYGRGTSDRDISATIEEIYGFKLSHETISDITEAVLPRVREWRERPLRAAYPPIFIDALYAGVKEERPPEKKAVYAIAGIDADGHIESGSAGFTNIINTGLQPAALSRDVIVMARRRLDAAREGGKDVLGSWIREAEGAKDGDAFVLPNKYATGGQPSNPYIFTDDEMTALFKAIDRLKPTANEPHLDILAPALFRLTYTCGLRPNEGRCLLRENVNLKTGEILITQTKRNIDRVVVMSDDMLKYAKRYDLRRGIFCDDSPYFFPASDGGSLPEQRVYAALNKAWGDAQRTTGAAGRKRSRPCLRAEIRYER